jgi:hypothetical protein
MAASANDSGSEKYLIESFRRFCRSIELCDDYLRGYYGLKLVGYPGEPLCSILTLADHQPSHRDRASEYSPV